MVTGSECSVEPSGFAVGGCVCVLLWLVDHSRPQKIRKNSVALLKAVFPGTPESGFVTQL